jgi:Domain of unknown function (DUF4062)
MSIELPLVFISSTSEFKEERKKLADSIRADEELGVVPYLYEVEQPSGRSPLKECSRRLRDSDLVILIIGAQFGTPLPEMSGLLGWCQRRFGGPSQPKSIVQWEYEYAKKLPRPLHPYVRVYPPDEVIEELQEKFRDPVTDFEKGTWSILYATSDQLVARSLKDLRKWRFSFWELYEKTRDTRQLWTYRVLLAATGVVACALGAIALISIRSNVSLAATVSSILPLAAALVILGYLLVKSGDIS